MNVLDLTPILLIATWVLFCCCEVHSLEDPVRKQSNLYHDCLKTCTAEDENSEESQDSKDDSECLRQCLLSNKGNFTSTYPQARHISTTERPLSNLTTDSRNDCPGADDLKARPNESIPGEVSALAVTFERERQPGGGQLCIASATWMVPKGVNRSMTWRGYLVIWNFETETTEETHSGYMVNCKLLPKNQTNFKIKAKNGSKYPVGISITVIALPTDKDLFQLSNFEPAIRDLQKAYFLPHHDKEQFQVQSPKGIAIILLSGLTFCLIFVGVVNICVKQKNLSGYDIKVMPRSGTTEKETRKNSDGQEEQLIA